MGGELLAANTSAVSGFIHERPDVGRKCRPASRWVKTDRLHPLIPRETLRWGKLYADRSAVERAFGRAKHEWGLLPLRVRGIERVKLHADLTVLAQLGCALARVRALAA